MRAKSRSGVRWMVGAVAAAAVVGGCARPGQEAPRSVAWNTAYAAALADAGSLGRPILLDFYTDW